MAYEEQVVMRASMRPVLLSVLLLGALGVAGAAVGADLAPRHVKKRAAVAVVPKLDPSACFGPSAPDLFCRHYGYRRGTDVYARCTSIIAGYGPGPALSNGYTINFDWTKKLPPASCRPPRLVIDPPENRPL
jgi:hypothetical protein